jgi:hypothetical protein
VDIIITPGRTLCADGLTKPLPPKTFFSMMDFIMGRIKSNSNLSYSKDDESPNSNTEIESEEGNKNM